MPITDWPKADRPREKLLTHGEQHLTDAELIAIFLSTGVRNKSALDIAKELLAETGSLKAVLQSSLQKKHGIGPAKYAVLKAAAELGRRLLAEPFVVGEKLNNFERVQGFLTQQLQQQPQEVFACLFLDQHCRLLAYEELFRGTVHEATVYPREIVRRCIYHNAAKLILAHNHPSGVSTPSRADKDLTVLIEKTLALIDVQVVDHVIIGNGECYSFAGERGIGI